MGCRNMEMRSVLQSLLSNHFQVVRCPHPFFLAPLLAVSLDPSSSGRHALLPGAGSGPASEPVRGTLALQNRGPRRPAEQ